MVVFAIGLFAAAFAAPFVIHATLGGELEADARWERSLLWWGGSLLALALGAALGLPSGFASDRSPALGLVDRLRGAARARDARRLAPLRRLTNPFRPG